MDSATHVLWVYSIHDKVRHIHRSFWNGSCPDCTFFSQSENFKDIRTITMPFREKLLLFHWGLCRSHIETVINLNKESEALHFCLERELGIYEEGFFRTLPDGRTCSIRTSVWRDYLLSLCTTPPT